MRRAAAIGGLAILLAAGAATGAEAPGPAASAAVSDLEARLAAARSVVFSFSVSSTGAFESRLEGRAVMEPGEIRLDADGTFGGRPAALTLLQADGRLSGGNGDARFEEPAPAATRDALLVGWIRMGVLHNLARLTAARPPDRADAVPAQWVTIHDVRRETPQARDGQELTPVSFGIRVAGQDSGTATLWIGEDGLPVFREQTVHFPGGEMIVVERYSEVSVGSPAL